MGIVKSPGAVRIPLEPYVGTDLLCVACGRFGADLGIASFDGGGPHAGVHSRRCVRTLRRAMTEAQKSKRKSKVDHGNA
jgi:hypothetical protein